ncbi:unnamed protein product [Somion occarium]|uniref:BTB domain-containing protein n=1 Tax=Somion occarium TaxID=3059160 RepID=A0ABP1DG14_9APHY
MSANDAAADTTGNEELKRLAENFQSDDADVIIRAGGVDFATYKFILSHASTIFKDMFTLPRNEAAQEGLPVVEVTEDAQTIHNLLSFLHYNTEDPDLSDLCAIHRILLASRKYDIAKLKTRIAKRLQAKAPENPARVFAIAYHAMLPDVVRIAAQHTLSVERSELILSFTPENHSISAEVFQNLIRYHTLCGEVAQAQLGAQQASNVCTGMPSDWSWFGCAECQPPTLECPGGSSLVRLRLQGSKKSRSLEVYPKKWWLDYLAYLGEKLKVQPASVDFADRDLLQRCSHVSSKCATCGPRAIPDLMKFAGLLEARVKSAVANVELKLDDNDFMI